MARIKSEDPKVEMTPMIDVVFQLLIFFVVTLKQEDILAKLMASRPAPDPSANPQEQPKLIDITISKHGFIMRGTPLKYEGVEKQLKKYSELSPNANVIIRCTADSKQSTLVQCLDLCTKYKLNNLSIFSM